MTDTTLSRLKRIPTELSVKLQSHAGIVRDKGRQHGRQEIDPGRATGAQAQGAPLQPWQFAQRPLRLLGSAQNLLRILLHNAARLRQDHLFAHPLDEHHPQFRFEGLHVFTDRWLADVEDLSGGAREAA